MENKFQILNLVASVMMMGTCCMFLAFIIKAWGRINHLTALVNALWDAELKRHEPKPSDIVKDILIKQWANGDINTRPSPTGEIIGTIKRFPGTVTADEFSEKLATGWMTAPERRKYLYGEDLSLAGKMPPPPPKPIRPAPQKPTQP